MLSSTKNILLVLILALIAGSIWYLEFSKTSPTLSLQQNNEPTVLKPDSAKNPGTRLMPLDEKAKQYKSAKEIIPGGGFINTPEFKLKDLIGKKVVLLDFWTYSCINCLRTLPYLKTWYQKYKDQGFIIIGVHTPEFDFEKDYSNVAKAVKDLNISYPVVQDNNYATWNAYENQYWPREYLIDIDGFIVHDHIGEGAYEETEKAIQKALEERKNLLNMDVAVGKEVATPKDVIPFSPLGVRSPETYFGSDRNEFLENGEKHIAGTQSLILPATLKSNALYLEGNWDFQDQFAENKNGGAKIIFRYNAKNVYLVASSRKGVKIKVLRDGKAPGAEAGKDVTPNGTVLIKDNRLYKLIEGLNYGEHTIEIEITEPGLQAFTFTFG